MCSKFFDPHYKTQTKKEIEMLKFLGADGKNVFMSNGRSWTWAQYIKWEDQQWQLSVDDMMTAKNEK